MEYKILNDGNWTIEYLSEGCIPLFGEETYKKILKQSSAFADLVHEDNCVNVIEYIEAALMEKRLCKNIYKINSTNDKDKWVLDQCEGIYSKNGDLIAATGIMTDFSEHRKKELDLKNEISNLKKNSSFNQKFCEIVGNSPEIKKTLKMMEQSSFFDDNILIKGETGTGKELIARLIHNKSIRMDNRFVPVNCGSMDEDSIEMEFFGCHLKDTSAGESVKKGLLDIADKGTLFLDEISKIPISFQKKLIRVMEGLGYTSIGGKFTKSPDIRIISATDKNISELIRKGEIISDFYFKTNVIELNIPPLRERIEDIPLLLSHFLSQKKASFFPDKIQISKIEKYGWPGNLREFENIINRFIITGEIDIPDCNPTKKERKLLPGLNLKKLVKAYEKELILEALEKYRSNKSKTAVCLGIDRRTLYSKIREYDLEDI